MQATLQPNGRRTGATWIAATGAFLLVVAAAVFVAVRWDSLPDAAKLAVVGALTGGFLVSGRSLRRTLPATGDVLFHLGAFLLPVDLAGLNLRLGLGWRQFLVAEGLLGVFVVGGLGLATDSVVLRWAGAVAMPVLAAGVAGLTPIPVALVLALVALGTDRIRDEHAQRAAAAWAAIAGLAPVVGAVAVWVVNGTGAGGALVLRDLGLGAGASPLAVLAAGAIAAGVLARQASERDDVVRALLAFAAAGVAGLTAWASPEIATRARIIGPAAAFAIIQVVALAGARDAFWRRPTHVLALITEWLALPAVALAGLLIAVAPLLDLGRVWRLDLGPDATAAVSFGLLALGWLTADLRRGEPNSAAPVFGLLIGSGSVHTTVAASAAIAAAVVVATASTVVIAAGLVVLAFVLVVSGRPLGGLTAAALAIWAPVVVWHHPAAALAVAADAALAVAIGAVLELRVEEPGERDLGHVLAACSAFALFVGYRFGPGVVWAAATVAGAWLLAMVLDRGTVTAGYAARAAMVLLTLDAFAFAAARTAAITAVVATLLLAVDAARLDRPVIGYGAAVTVQIAIVAGARALAVATPSIGLCLCVAAVVWAGFAAVADDGWRTVFLAAASASTALGLVIASTDPVTLCEAVMVAGGLALAAALVLHEPAAVHLAGAIVVGAFLARLWLAGVSASEAYITPVALYLCLAGSYARRRFSVSSWVAYGPAVGLLGGAAFVERVAGGPGWHAVVAGAVGVAAVAVGGGRRLIAPLLLGTALLVATAVHESLATLAGVPTWAWLALGGSVLLVTGVALERTDTSPVETGRRVVDLVSERFQ